MVAKILSYVPAIIGLLSIGLFILLNNPKNIKNRLFFMVNIVTVLWLSFLFLADIANDQNISLWFLRFALFFGQLIFLFFFLFSLYFPYKTEFKKFLVLLLTLPMLVMAMLLLTSYGVTSVVIQKYGVQPDEVGVLYGFSDLMGIIYLLLAALILVVKYRKSNIQQKNQIRFVLYGLSFAVLANVLTGVVFTTFKIDSGYLFVGGFSLFVFSLFVAYSMIKHKLFDVRLVVFRSLGYLLSLSTISIISFLSLTFLSGILDTYQVASSMQRAIFVVLTLVLAVSYQPFKKFFDSLTSKLFYRDAYETQTFLNEFNQVIVTTIDLNQLLMRAGATIEKYLKPDSVSFAIRDSDADTVRIISGTDTKVAKEAVEQMRAYVHDSSEKLFITDVLDESQNDLKQLLQETSTGLFARITTNLDVEGNGYIIIGYKKSGNMYNSQDIGAMEIVANELAIAMQNALQFDEIQKFAVTLQEKVDDATKKLRRSNEKLKQMDETKDEFISMASHQLRTPLTSVKGYVSMVIEGDAGDLNPMQKKLLDQAFVSSQRMVYLIADLLNVSRLRTGKFVIDSAPTNLADVVQGEVEQLIETAAGRGLELTYEKPKDFPTLMMDETKIRQVVMNFIDNAIYYTPHGGHIIVSLKDTGKTIEYAIIDDGLGVPKSQQHHLFSKFFRADNAKKARPDGTGLGLFMAKKVIVAQGGSIIFKSTEGEGSTFGFSFDKAKLAVPDHFEAKEPLNGIKFGPTPSPDK